MLVRPTPSFVVAVLALVIAAGGAGYAAATIGSAQIKNDSVRSVDIKNGTVVNRDLGAGIDGAKLRRASVPSRVLKRDCPGSALRVAGVCFEKKTNPKRSLQKAIEVCHGKGGRIATIAEIKLLPTVNGVINGVTWADNMLNQYEFTSTYIYDGGLHALSADYDGTILPMGDNLARGFHCVTYP